MNLFGTCNYCQGTGKGKGTDKCNICNGKGYKVTNQHGAHTINFLKKVLPELFPHMNWVDRKTTAPTATTTTTTTLASALDKPIDLTIYTAEKLESMNLRELQNVVRDMGTNPRNRTAKRLRSYILEEQADLTKETEATSATEHTTE